MHDRVLYIRDNARFACGMSNLIFKMLLTRFYIINEAINNSSEDNARQVPSKVFTKLMNFEVQQSFTAHSKHVIIRARWCWSSES